MKYIILTAREIANQETVNSFIEDKLNKATNENVKKWIKKILRLYLLNDHEETVEIKHTNPKYHININTKIKEGQEVLELKIRPMFTNKINHVIDFLNTLPDKEIKYTVPVAIEKAEEWTKRLVKKASSEEDTEGIRIVRKYKDGFKWVSVFSEQALEREGKLMHLCVGNGHYFNEVEKGRCLIFSLRNKHNVPFVTVEYRIKEKEISQIKGYRDNAMHQIYHKYMMDFVNRPIFGLKISKIHKDDLHLNWLVFKNNKLYSELKMKNLVIDGSLNISRIEDDFGEEHDVDYGARAGESFLNFDMDYVKTFPEGLTINGDFILTGSNIEALPERLKVEGDLLASDSKITELPKEMSIGKSISVSGTAITKLPDNLKVEGNLDLSYCRMIKKLPKNLKVEGTLNLNNSTVVELPEDLNSNGLNVSYTSIEYIPFKVIPKNSSLRLYDSKVKELPENLVLDTLEAGSLVRFPKNLTVRELNMTGSKITAIPNIKVDNLWLSGGKVTRLPKNFHLVSLELGATLEELPEGLVLQSTLDLRQSNIREIGKNTKAGALIASHSKLEKINTNSIFTKFCTLSGSKVKELPFDLKTNDLDISNTSINYLPKTIKVGRVITNNPDLVVPNNLKNLIYRVK